MRIHDQLLKTPICTAGFFIGATSIPIVTNVIGTLFGRPLALLISQSFFSELSESQNIADAALGTCLGFALLSLALLLKDLFHKKPGAPFSISVLDNIRILAGSDIPLSFILPAVCNFFISKKSIENAVQTGVITFFGVSVIMIFAGIIYCCGSTVQNCCAESHHTQPAVTALQPRTNADTIVIHVYPHQSPSVHTLQLPADLPALYPTLSPR